VVIVSSELDEIYALADRIAVMYEGKITGFRDPGVPPAELGRLMAGGVDVAPAPAAEDPPPSSGTDAAVSEEET
jgi:ABC-type sugar transport system ATPase subunit